MRLQDLLAPHKKYLPYTGGCGSCPRKIVDYVPPTLKKSKIILVGEAPGEKEVEEKQGFIGPSGQILRTALERVGIRDYSFTNTIHCRPPENKDPTPSEISCCMNEHVIPEIADYPLVVLVGAVAANAFYPGDGSLLRGNLAYHPDFPQSRFYGMLHPAAILHDASRKDEFYRHVDRLGRIYRGDDSKFRIISGEQFRRGFEFMLQTSRLIGLDIETNQLESWVPGGIIRSFAVVPVPSDEVFVIDRDDPFWNSALHLLKTYLLNPEKQVLGQVIGFDLVWLEAELNFRCNVKYVHDIQSLFYLHKRYIQVGLKKLVSEELDGYRHLVVDPGKEPNIEHLKLYNAEDIYHTQHLFLDAFPKLRPQTQNLFLTIGGRSTLALRRVQHQGIYFRDQEWDSLVAINRKKRAEAVAAWRAADPQFDPREYITSDGTKGINKFLFEVKKYPVLKKTPKGEPSADDEVLHEMIRSGATELEPLLVIREMDKEYSTYLKPYPKILCPYTHRIHASYHNTTVSTGRLSSTDPNMQNVKRGPIRNLFGAPPGSKFIEGDWSQIELRIAMSEANAKNGIQAYRDKKDLHTVTAQLITGREKVTKEERQDAKPANFCFIYDGSPETAQAYAQDTYGIIMSIEDARKWHRGFFQVYPELVDWHRETKQKLRENKGYIESAVGHVWYYSDWDSTDDGRRQHAERAAINMLCQGPAAYFTTYLIYLSQQEFYKRSIPSEIVLTVHDQLAWEATEQWVQPSSEVVQREVQHVGEWASWLKVPIVFDLKIGEAWGSLEEMK